MGKTLRAVRKPLGKLSKRKLITKTFQTFLPGAPDREVVVIQFDTAFENKKTAIQTVTPMLGKDGRGKGEGFGLLYQLREVRRLTKRGGRSRSMI